jgi:predicted DNA-binding protein with PD1-like motif
MAMWHTFVLRYAPYYRIVLFDFPNQGKGKVVSGSIFDKGDEFMEGITQFAGEKRLGGSHFTAIGAFSGALLGYFDRNRKDYTKIPIDEQTEVLSLVGDIAFEKDKPKVYAHVVLGKSDGTAHGGHILRRTCGPLEVIVSEMPAICSVSTTRRRPRCWTVQINDDRKSRNASLRAKRSLVND